MRSSRTLACAILFLLCLTPLAHAETIADIRDFTGAWLFYQNGNSGTLDLTQSGNRISGVMTNHNGATWQVQGSISPGPYFDVLVIRFDRIGEPQTFTGYMHTHGEMAGLAMSGTFTYNGQEACGWYATRLHR